MCKKNMEVSKGEIYWFDFSNYGYHGYFYNADAKKQQSCITIKKRPYIVVSIGEYNMVTLCPLTSSRNQLNKLFRTLIGKDEKYWHDGQVPDGFGDEVVLINQLLTVDSAALDQYVGKVSEEVMTRIDVLLSMYLGIKVQGLDDIYSFINTIFEQKYEMFKRKIIKEYEESVDLAALAVQQIKSKFLEEDQRILQELCPGNIHLTTAMNVSETLPVQYVDTDTAVVTSESDDSSSNKSKPKRQSRSTKSQSKEKSDDIPIVRLRHKRWVTELQQRFVNDCDSGKYTDDQIAKMYSIEASQVLNHYDRFVDFLNSKV